MSGTYTDFEIINLAKIPKPILHNKIRTKSVPENLAWIRKLQYSLSRFSKRNKDMIETQMEIIGIVSHIESYCRPFIYYDMLAQVKTKYPRETPERHKIMAKDKMEKTLIKYHY